MSAEAQYPKVKWHIERRMQDIQRAAGYDGYRRNRRAALASAGWDLR